MEAKNEAPRSARQLAEKDVTLAFGRRLRQELETRGLATLLLRDSDITLSLDQRASLTNSAHAAIYICLHAASQGQGVRVYTALVPSDTENRGPFLSWDAAQNAFQLLSQPLEAVWWRSCKTSRSGRVLDHAAPPA